MDGDGLVYFLLPADWDGQYDMTPVDEADYEAWRDTCFAGAEELLVPSENLTEENIEALGCPRPDMEIPEPAG